MTPEVEGWYRVQHWTEAGKFFDYGVQYCRIGREGWWFSAHTRATRPRYCPHTSGLIRRNAPLSDGVFKAIPEAAP